MELRGISIIIPVYNAGEYLEEAVSSLVVQNIKEDYEIIVVDDGSDDITTQQVLEKVSKFSRVRLFKQHENSGVQATRNIGLKKSKFRYILTLDADDCLRKEDATEKTYIDKAVVALEKDERIAFVHCFSEMFGRYSGLTISAYPLTENLVLEKHHVPTSIVYRRDDALKSGMYDRKISKWQDWSFGVAILNTRFLNGKINQIKCVKKACHSYRIHSQPSRVSSQNVDELQMTKITFKRHPEIFRRHYPAFSDKDIPATILSHKPDKLKDLLFVANDDLERALTLMRRRGFHVNATNEIRGIP